MAMHINPAHKGLFTKKAHAAGKGVQEYANEKAGAGGKLGKEANFARMAKRHFKPLSKTHHGSPHTASAPTGEGSMLGHLEDQGASTHHTGHGHHVTVNLHFEHKGKGGKFKI